MSALTSLRALAQTHAARLFAAVLVAIVMIRLAVSIAIQSAPDDFWRLFDPASCAEIAQAAAGSDMLHLWSELWRRMNWDLDAAPPPGAYLHQVFAEVGALAVFSRTASRAEVEALAARWRAGAPA